MATLPKSTNAPKTMIRDIHLIGLKLSEFTRQIVLHDMGNENESNSIASSTMQIRIIFFHNMNIRKSWCFEVIKVLNYVNDMAHHAF